MSRKIVSGSSDAVVERMRPEDVATADGLWLTTVDKAIEGEEKTIRALQEHVYEIDETMQALEALHEKIQYDAMIPYGRVAMFTGKLIRTNEVHVHLSQSYMVHTSTKHAKTILQRRRDYAVEKQELVQQQLDALKSRRVFADYEKMQDGEKIEEIVEVYDEKVHGPLNAPMVRDEVYAGRRYYGPPRNEKERSAHEAEMEALRTFVAKHAERPRGAQDARQAPPNQSTIESRSDRSTDSDDEDASTIGPQPMPAGARGLHQHAAPQSGGPQLQEELDRLVAAFEGATATNDEGQATTKDRTQPKARPLIQEIQNVTAAQPLDTEGPGKSTGSVTAARASASAHRVGLRHGFFNKSAKPKKGILKQSNPPAERVQHVTPGPTVACALATKHAPTAAELNAFSGVVKERSGPAEVSDNRDKPQKSTKRVSKFKSQRAAAAGNPSEF